MGEGVGGYGKLWAGVGGCGWGANVCGMNFQNFFLRIESLHQRTLIRILYEFFMLTLLFRYFSDFRVLYSKVTGELTEE